MLCLRFDRLGAAVSLTVSCLFGISEPNGSSYDSLSQRSESYARC